MSTRSNTRRDALFNHFSASPTEPSRGTLCTCLAMLMIVLSLSRNDAQAQIRLLNQDRSVAVTASTSYWDYKGQQWIEHRDSQSDRAQGFGSYARSLRASSEQVGALAIATADQQSITSTSRLAATGGSGSTARQPITDTRASATAKSVYTIRFSVDSLVMYSGSVSCRATSSEYGCGPGETRGRVHLSLYSTQGCSPLFEGDVDISELNDWAADVHGVLRPGTYVLTAVAESTASDPRGCPGDSATVNTTYSVDIRFSTSPPSLPADRWTVIVHGRSGFSYEELTGQTGWMRRLADRINSIRGATPVEVHRMDSDSFTILPGSDPTRRDAHHVLLFDWTDTSNDVDHGFAYAAGTSLYSFLKQYDAVSKTECFIGFSRGAVVVSAATQMMQQFGNESKQVIFLDGEGAPFWYQDSVFECWQRNPYEPKIRYDNVYSTFNEHTNGCSSLNFGGNFRGAAFNTNLGNAYAHQEGCSRPPIWEWLIGNLNYYGEYCWTQPTGCASERGLTPATQVLPFNGDFEWRSEAGWRSHGGEGTAYVAGTYLELVQARPSRIHSYSYVPANTNYLQFSAGRGANTSGTVQITWNGDPFYSIRVRDLDRTWGTRFIAIPPSAVGGVGRLGVQLVDAGLFTRVGIDDLQFVP